MQTKIVKHCYFFRKSVLFLILLLTYTSVFADSDRIDFHMAYAYENQLLIEGRMVESRNIREPAENDSRRRNFKRSVKQFFNDEADDELIWLGFVKDSWFVQTDDEGYFRLDARTSEVLNSGWHDVRAYSNNAAETGKVLVVSRENTLGLISDLDDTIIVSEVLKKRRLLSNTFLKNPLQRKPFPGMAELYQQVARVNKEPESAPIFYLSASPRQLSRGINAFLQHNKFPQGVLITKRLDNNPLFDQTGYKAREIQEVFDRLPNVRFILVGDDGEKDPEIYQEIREKYPDRVEAIWIREVNKNPDRPKFDNQLNLDEVVSQKLNRVEPLTLDNLQVR